MMLLTTLLTLHPTCSARDSQILQIKAQVGNNAHRHPITRRRAAILHTMDPIMVTILPQTQVDTLPLSIRPRVVHRLHITRLAIVYRSPAGTLMMATMMRFIKQISI